MSEELKERVMAAMRESSAKNKKKLYIKDLAKKIEGVTKHEVQDAVKELLNEKKLSYWSSGSTTYLMLMEDFEAYKHMAEDHEEPAPESN